MVSQDQPKRGCRWDDLPKETSHSTTKDPVELKLPDEWGCECYTEPLKSWGSGNLRSWGSEQDSEEQTLHNFQKPVQELGRVKSGWFNHGEEGALTLSQIDRIYLSPPKYTSSVAFDKILDFPELPVEWAQCPLSQGLFWRQWDKVSVHAFFSWHLLVSFAWNLKALGSTLHRMEVGLAVRYSLIPGHMPQGKSIGEEPNN